MELLNRSESDGIYSSVYNFDAIKDTPGEICGPGTRCEGWSLSGRYTVNTDAQGESSLTVDATLNTGKKFTKSSMFGLGWGISYGINDDKTESYLALWSY